MIETGKYSRLKVIKSLGFGVYLCEEGGPGLDFPEILLPMKYVPSGLNIGDMIDVFVYRDSENRPVATTLKPFVTLNDFASLEVKDVNKYGAFLDWGVENQLLLPFREQPQGLKTGDRVVVMLYLDRVSDRLVATSKIERHLRRALLPEDLTRVIEGDKVSLLIYDNNEIGWKAVVIHEKTPERYTGIIYHNDLYKEIRTGDSMTGYIKFIREDGKIDLTIRETGLDAISSAKAIIIKELEKSGGFIELNDDSPPEAISKRLSISKKTFKRAVGMLYKEGFIQLFNRGIKLSKPF